MLRVVVIGAGKWAHECWTSLLREHADRYAVEAVVDPERDRAISLATGLGLSADHAFSDLDEALGRRSAINAGIVLSSPERHVDGVVRLAAAKLDVLSEKPLATNPADVQRIADTVACSGVKLAVIQNARYQNRIQTARRIMASEQLGDLRYITVRFAADYRVHGSWDVGDAHEMAHPLLIEGAIHHIDLIRYLSGLEIHDVTAITANPPGSSFAGDCIGALLLRLEHGRFALYEATLLAAGHENRWRSEHYRLEYANGTLVFDGETVILSRGRHSQTIPAPDRDAFDGHRAQLHAFADWVNNGPKVETTIDDNTRSLAAIFAAIQSSEHQRTVPVDSLARRDRT